MNEVLQSWLDQEEERLIDQKNVHSLYICASRAKEGCKLTGTESELLFTLACYADYDGTNISVGRDRLMQRTGYSANTIGAAMKTLQRKGLVIRDGYGKFGVAKYRLNLPGHYMYIDPKQTDKVTPLPTSRIKNPAPQDIQVQPVQPVQPVQVQPVQPVQPVQVQPVQQVQVQQVTPSIVDGTAYYPSDQVDNSRDEDHDIKQLVIMRNAKKKGAPINFAASCKRFGIDVKFFEDFCKSDLLKDWSITSEMEHIILKKPVEEWDFTFAIPYPELTAINSGQETELPF